MGWPPIQHAVISPIQAPAEVDLPRRPHSISPWKVASRNTSELFGGTRSCAARRTSKPREFKKLLRGQDGNIATLQNSDVSLAWFPASRAMDAPGVDVFL